MLSPTEDAAALPKDRPGVGYVQQLHGCLHSGRRVCHSLKQSPAQLVFVEDASLDMAELHLCKP